jgi:hypothetical protein
LTGAFSLAVASRLRGDTMVAVIRSRSISRKATRFFFKSVDVLERVSATATGIFETAAQVGRTHTAEARAKMSAAHAGNKNSLGYKHSASTRAKVRSTNWIRAADHQTRNVTGFKGVKFLRGRYYSLIMLNGKRINLAGFDTAEEAGITYARAAAERLGEIARAP